MSHPQTTERGSQHHAPQVAIGTQSPDAGRLGSNEGRSHRTCSPLGTTPPGHSSLKLRLARLKYLQSRLAEEVAAVERALLIYTDEVRPKPQKVAYQFTEREMKAAHTLHAAGEKTPWVDAGERAYQRSKKREERARKKVA